MSLIYGTDQGRVREGGGGESFDAKWLKVIKSWHRFKGVTRILEFW